MIAQQANTIRAAKNASLTDYIQHTPIVTSTNRQQQQQQQQQRKLPTSNNNMSSPPATNRNNRLSSTPQSAAAAAGMISPGKPLNISHISPQDSVSLLSSPDDVGGHNIVDDNNDHHLLYSDARQSAYVGGGRCHRRGCYH